jgi:hypothetical protein
MSKPTPQRYGIEAISSFSSSVSGHMDFGKTDLGVFLASFYAVLDLVQCALPGISFRS